MFPIAIFQVSHHYAAWLSLEPAYQFLPKWAFANARNEEEMWPETCADSLVQYILMYLIIDA